MQLSILIPLRRFFDAVKNSNCTPVMEPVVEFEFYRGARNNKEKRLHQEFIAAVFGDEVFRLARPQEETFEIAQKIASIAYISSNKTLDLANCIISAQIAKHSTNKTARLYLATQNHTDFPPAIFDRIHTKLIELPDGKIKTIGIYCIDNDRLEKLSK